MRIKGFTALLALAAAFGLSLTAPAAAAEAPAPPDAPAVGVLAKPAFLAPFECGSEWTYSTYPGHGNVLDFIRSDGKPSLGSPVLASAAGTATRHYQEGGAGQYIVIEHGDGWRTEYMHLDTYGVEDGARVEQGDKIGTVGSTGGSTGPHLHLQHKLNGALQDIELEGTSLVPYPGEYGEKFLTSTNGCGGEEPPPPVQKDTRLAWTGPASAANGSPVRLSATLTEKDGGAPVDGRKVGFTLGTGAGAQSCEGTTDAQGAASCSIASVDQPLGADATVPATAAFAGDDDFKASDTSATLKLQYVSGRAFGLSARVPVLLIPIAIAPTPDTGEVRTAGAETKAPPCTQNINALVLTAQAPCAKVVTTVGPSTATASATLAEATVGLPGLPVVRLSGVTATSTSSCTAKEGSTELDLSIAGTPVTVPDTPNHTIDLGVGAKIVVNEQTETADGFTVTAARITAPGGVDVVIASSTSGAHNCA
ncbi:M23 family metallopeptidase [Streptomyces vilmorinianum]|uniref:M23 family metallopeptidase n=1 Tax=Streptomyces vilmorinianum TaxID=3051092 RepID=UPI0010FB87F7|nr:M23 family metallopeptidase [Streptomyces vilmorinianum]